MSYYSLKIMFKMFRMRVLYEAGIHRKLTISKIWLPYHFECKSCQHWGPNLKTLAAHTIQNPPEYPPWESTLVRRRSLDVKRLNFCGVYRGGSRIFFSRGCTRLVLYFNTNKPHSFFFPQNTSCIRKPQVISGGWGGAHPLHPPPRSAPVSTWGLHPGCSLQICTWVPCSFSDFVTNSIWWVLGLI